MLRSNPRTDRSRGPSPLPPKIAVPLVRYASRLTCRSKSRPAMSFPRLGVCQARADARHIVEDFLDRVQAIVALDDDVRGRMPDQRIVEQIERLLGQGMGMGVR